ncbi:hypothetical protein IC575_004922 [Cucumis melo]
MERSSWQSASESCDRVLVGIFDELRDSGMAEIKATHIGETHQIEQHIRYFFFQMLSLCRAPVR